MGAKEEILAIERRFIDAPLDQALSYMDEAHVRYDFIPPLQYVGKAAVRSVFELFFSNAKDWKGEFLELDAVAGDDLGTAYSLQRITWTAPDGKPAAATVRVTHCFRKVDGEWKMFHSHVSAPIHAVTGRAEMNLTK